MNLFVDYVQPLTNWLQENPNWALFITFLISLTESLVIIGSIIPGSVTMTAIGILAGSGIMRIDLTLIAAILGAVAGDSLSYAIGYYYSDKLMDIWPFSRYPTALAYGKDFFNRHGGKSVLFGRFVGPLRSLIPVIAGIMHMKQWRFIIANVLSAILWSLLYVMPGVLIGAASNELSSEGATRLIIFILVLLAGVWFLSLTVKWLLIKINAVLKPRLHNLWSGLKSHPTLTKYIHLITPKNEVHHYQTALLLIMLLLSFIAFILLSLLSLNVNWHPNYNIPIHLFIQSLRTSALETFFIFCTQLTSPLTLSVLFIFWCVWFIKQKNRRAVNYLTSIILTSSALAIVLAQIFFTPRPQGFVVTMQGSSYFAVNLAIATAVYGFILFYISSHYTLLTNLFRSCILAILSLAGLGFIYLGDYWLTDVLTAYFAGITLCLMHCLKYRSASTVNKESHQSSLLITLLIAIILISSTLSTYLHFKTIKYNHTLYHKEYSINEINWWDQTQPLLPLYLSNRIGQRISLLNIQYAGDLDLLENSLEIYGWKSHNESFLTKLLLRMNPQSKEVKLPLLDLLYNNKHPELIMTYTKAKSPLILELRLWESPYFFKESSRPIWIGSVHYSKQYGQKLLNKAGFIDPLTFILPALNEFTVRRIEISKKIAKPTIIPTTPYVLLIKKEAGI